MITNSNLHTQAYSDIKSFLDSLNLDPRHRLKPNWIHASMPNINSKGFDGYPFIVLKVMIGENNKSMDVSISQKTFRAVLMIYSDDASDIDAISDLIYSGIKDEANLTSFGSKEMSSSEINYSMDEHGKKILYRTIGLILRGRI